MASLIVRGSDDPEARARVAQLPCVVMDETDYDAFADALAENLAREDLSRAEVMEALLRLQQDYDWSARYIARRIGRSKSDVIELLGIAKDESVAPMVRDEIITPTTAGQIRRLPEHLRPKAIEGVRAGRVKTVEDVRRIRREERKEAERARAEQAASDDGKVTDIGHSGQAANSRGRKRQPPEDDQVRLLPVQGAAVEAAAEVVRAVNSLTRLMALVDPDTLNALQKASDNLDRYVQRALRTSEEK